MVGLLAKLAVHQKSTGKFRRVGSKTPRVAHKGGRSLFFENSPVLPGHFEI